MFFGRNNDPKYIYGDWTRAGVCELLESELNFRGSQTHVLVLSTKTIHII